MADEVEKITTEETQVIERLRPQWTQIVRGLGGNLEYANEAFTEIVTKYRMGDGRAHHNLFHIDRMLSFVNQFDHLAQNKHSLKAAIFGHDIVYVPGSGTNEQESANVFGLILQKILVKEDDVAGIKRLIMVTQEHKATDADIDGQLIIDGDFEILSSANETYDNYTANIWRENVGSGKVSEEAFKKGRRHFVNSWLELIRENRLFLIPEIREKLQPQAKKNLERELLCLN
mgnify:CR=1 FL=1